MYEKFFLTFFYFYFVTLFGWHISIFGNLINVWDLLPLFHYFIMLTIRHCYSLVFSRKIWNKNKNKAKIYIYWEIKFLGTITPFRTKPTVLFNFTTYIKHFTNKITSQSFYYYLNTQSIKRKHITLYAPTQIFERTQKVRLLMPLHLKYS